MTILLSDRQPFAQGGNRLCFIHPADPAKCIKVRRPDFTLEQRRQKKGFPKNLKPLSSFDDNLEEFRVMKQLTARFKEPLFEHVSRCHGFVDTDMGRGLVSQLIRDDSQRIAHTLKQYLWDYGLTDNSQQAIATFAAHWQQLGVPSHDLLVHNIVVPRDSAGQIIRLVVIDGLSSGQGVPLAWLPDSWLRKRAAKKIRNLRERIDQLLSLRGTTDFPGYHGKLFHEGIEENQST